MVGKAGGAAMSQDRPVIDDILATVERFLEDCRGKLEGETRYHAQVAAYLLGICRRELRLAPQLDAAERARLTAFLGVDAASPELDEQLAAAIREGRLDGRWDELLDLVLAATVSKVAIVRPAHLAPEHRAALPQDFEAKP
jgi:hypothetical protein